MQPQVWRRVVLVVGAAIIGGLTVPVLAQNSPFHTDHPGNWQGNPWQGNPVYDRGGSNARQAWTLAAVIATNIYKTQYRYPQSGMNLARTITIAQPRNSWFGGIQYNAFTDCSGFVSYVLSQALGINNIPFKAILKQQKIIASQQKPGKANERRQPWPRAFVYWSFFSSISPSTTVDGWTSVQDLRTVMPGDVIAWCMNEDPNSNPQKGPFYYCNLPYAGPGDTGHVFFVAGPARQANDSKTWRVPVYDSSTLVHHDDGYKQSQAPQPYKPKLTPCTQEQKRCGVASGEIWFRVNNNGIPEAFQFGPGDRWIPFTLPGQSQPPGSNKVTRVAIGRLL